MSALEYDLVVIGSGPAGQKCAIAAAKARKRVAVIDRAGMIGGVTVHTGTIPSKTVREAIFQLGGLAVNALYGNGPRSRVDILHLSQPWGAQNNARQNFASPINNIHPGGRRRHPAARSSPTPIHLQCRISGKRAKSLSPDRSPDDIRYHEP